MAKGRNGKELRLDGFFDIETATWDRFAMGGLYTAHDKDFRYTCDSSECFEMLMDNGGHIWAWNGGLFDFLWFLDEARRRGYYASIATAGTRITRIEIDRLVLRDAVALVPSSLAKAAPMAGIELSKDTGLTCECGESCGGYCRITPRCKGMTRGQKSNLAEYLELDCSTGAKIIDALFGHALQNGYSLRGTIGGSAWNTAREMLNLDPIKWSNGREYYTARAGYYGGRVTVGRVSVSTGFRYDINSAYPAALANLQLPTGNRIRVSGNKASKHYRNGSEGIYFAQVEIPRDMHLPPLPKRTPKGRVCYPVGRFVGAWSGYELRHAEDVGARILRFVSAIVWEESEVVFGPFMNAVFKERQRVGKNSAFGKWQKLFANSLTGKFAQSPESERVVMHPREKPKNLCPGEDCGNCGGRKGRCCNCRCVGTCKKWRQIDLYGHIWGIPFWSLPDSGYVHWAAYLTSWARVKWHRMALMFDKDFAYGDTDSVFAASQAPQWADVGTELGQWAFDGQMEDFECLGPKAYRYKDETGKVNARLKGVSVVGSEDWQRFADGYVVQNERGVYGLRSAAKKGDSLFVRKQMKRSDKSDGVWYGDRKLIAGSTITRPVTYDEQCARER